MDIGNGVVSGSILVLLGFVATISHTRYTNAISSLVGGGGGVGVVSVGVGVMGVGVLIGTMITGFINMGMIHFREEERG